MRHRTEEGIEELRYFVRAARTPVGFNEFQILYCPTHDIANGFVWHHQQYLRSQCITITSTTYEEIKLKRVTEIQD
jgi:hypothetical protein